MGCVQRIERLEGACATFGTSPRQLHRRRPNLPTRPPKRAVCAVPRPKAPPARRHRESSIRSSRRPHRGASAPSNGPPGKGGIDAYVANRIHDTSMVRPLGPPGPCHQPNSAAEGGLIRRRLLEGAVTVPGRTPARVRDQPARPRRNQSGTGCRTLLRVAGTKHVAAGSISPRKRRGMRARHRA